jgi:hypothetical protein
MAIWNNLLTLEIFYDHLVHFVLIWCNFGTILVQFWCNFGAILVQFWCNFGAILVQFCVNLVQFSGFGIIYQEKSGNPGPDECT